MPDCESQPNIPEELLSAIYCGTLSDEPWLEALHMLNEVLGSEWCTLRLVVRNRPTPREKSMGQTGKPVEVLADFLEHQAAEFLPKNLSERDAVITDWNESELHGDSLRYKKQYDIATSISVCVAAFEKSMCVLQLTRTKKQGKYSKADLAYAQRIGEHFGNAIRMRRVAINAMAMSDLQADALNSFGIGGILITPDGSIHMINRIAEDIVADANGLKVINQRLVAVDTSDNSKLQQAIVSALSQSSGSSESRGLNIRRCDARPPLSAVIKTRPYLPLISNGGERCAIVYVRDPEILTLADTKILQELFDFTPAEAKLAVYLTTGMQMEEIEDTLNICHNTTRAHLRSMYQKSQVGSLAELIQVLAKCAAPLGRQDPVEAGFSDRPWGELLQFSTRSPKHTQN